ncbi:MULTISPECIES: type VI secretion system baseplate subunit TssF [Pseudomonas]|uniref:Type VI secretion system protein ImpG n=1 Tax=Pseudomonas fluorescens LMG 5329 TaxID=1324332 RepID=A0A0A1YVL9_PSEFL|nr:type VI secretion system baseplate subunit TssF [Pseudomonas fluorescens]KGE65024.1 type VI secretion system protein ImpG [Pseudomonas fluorescens LMG 5329]NWD99758.1 type VI secretion system baseplate subunit TssF [Pseudomonas sp. IPO3749]NWF21465.1 type VI secretion system baseplate subunit TssF [Pseudomonas sp. IPO3749]
MNAKLLRYYERELAHLREVGGEFARDYPKVAGRLGLETYACADPYVERLLEGFSFLAARVQLKIDAEFPRFTNHLLELVYPQYLAPTPSMAVVQLQPDMGEGSLASGFKVPRDTALHSQLGKGDQTACEFRTAHDVTLWPVELVEARYFACGAHVAGVDLSRLGGVKAALRLRLRVGAGLTFSDLSLDNLPLHIRGGDAMPSRILEHLLAQAVGVLVMPVQEHVDWHQFLPKSAIRSLGYSDSEALLPTGPRQFQGYRLLQEYFAMPQRFMFADVVGLANSVSRCSAEQLDVIVLFKKLDPLLEQSLSAANFGLYCTPAINLFPMRAERVHLSDQQSEYHVIADRTRPMDYEIYQIEGVTGYGSGAEASQTFESFYRANDLHARKPPNAFYQVRRDARVLSEQQHRQGPRSSYIGSELFLSLVDAQEAPHRSDLRQLGIDTLCSNRDLVLSMPVGSGRTDFSVESGAPVQAVRCLTGPTVPAPSFAEGETAWRLVSHLSLNYLSLLDQDKEQGASALRELLRLYCRIEDEAAHKQIEGLRSVTAESIVRRLPLPGPITYGRGLQVCVTLDEAAFEGAGVFVLGSVLEQFFAKYVSLNAFTETLIKSTTRGVIMQWPARVGRCEIL